MTAGQQASTYGGERVSLPPSIAVFEVSISPANCTVDIRLNNTGDLMQNANGAVTDIGDWISPKQNMGLYEARMSVISGALTSGSVNTWEALSVSRIYTVQRTTVGFTLFRGTLEIRRIGSIFIFATSSPVELRAEKAI